MGLSNEIITKVCWVLSLFPSMCHYIILITHWKHYFVCFSKPLAGQAHIETVAGVWVSILMCGLLLLLSETMVRHALTFTPSEVRMLMQPWCKTLGQSNRCFIIISQTITELIVIGGILDQRKERCQVYYQGISAFERTFNLEKSSALNEELKGSCIVSPSRTSWT